MDISIFLAKFLGLYLLIVGLVWIVRRGDFLKSLNDFLSSKGTLFLSGFISLLFGLAIAIVHTHWGLDWKGVITLLGYLAIFKGILRIGFPDYSTWRARSLVDGHGWIVVTCLTLVGLYLSLIGFGIISNI